MKKLLFVHDHRFYIRFDGTVVSKVAFTMSHWERYLEHADCVTVVGRNGGRMESAEAGAGVPAGGAGVSFELFPSAAGLSGLVRRRKIAEKLSEIISDVDAVVIRLPSELGLLALRAANKQRMPMAIELVGCPLDALRSHGSAAARAYAPIMYLRTRRAVWNASNVLYVTERFLQERYPTRASNRVSASNVIVSVDENVKEMRVARVADTLRNGVLTLGFIGALSVKYKGLDVLLRAMADLRCSETTPRLRLEVVGEGCVANWQKLVTELGLTDCVKFQGILNGTQEVLAWMDDLDVLVQPSRTEGLPRTVIEAMSRALPVLGSRVGGIPELIADSCLHEPGDAGILAEQIKNLCGDAERRLDLGISNLERAKSFDERTLSKVRSHFYATALRG